MKILFINAVCGVGSTGRIVIDLMNQARQQGHKVKVACSTVEAIRNVKPEDAIIVGSKFDYYIHNILSRLTDHEGLYSKIATKKLIQRIREYDPDLIHLHNIHGHWINYELLFRYLASENKKVIWTLHDCWAFTGHCSHFSFVECEQWKKQCKNCINLKSYPKCIGNGDVSKNYDRKKKAFTSINDMTIVTPSKWLANLVKHSFFKGYNVDVVHNRIDLSVFAPSSSDFRTINQLEGKIIVLGVANVWNRKKGLYDFIKLRELLNEHYAVVMVGLTKDQITCLPNTILAIERTKNVKELVDIYSTANVFVNLTYQDTFPTVNLEAIACGTPVVSYITGGSCEAFDDKSGISVPQGAIDLIPDAIEKALLLKPDDILNRRTVFFSYGDYRKYY